MMSFMFQRQEHPTRGGRNTVFNDVAPHLTYRAYAKASFFIYIPVVLLIGFLGLMTPDASGQESALPSSIMPVHDEYVAEPITLLGSDSGSGSGSKPTQQTISTPTPANSPYSVLYGAILKTQQQPIALDDILQRVAQENLLIQRKHQSYKVERVNFYKALIDPLPDIKGVYSHRRFQGVIQLFGNETLNIYQTSIEPKLLVRQHIDLGGKQIFNMLGTRRQAQATESLLQQTQQDRLAQSAQAYYQFLESLFTKDASLKGIDEADEQVRISEARLKQGVGTRLEVLQAKSLQAQRFQELIDAEKAIATQEETLLNLMNLPITIQLVPQADAPIPYRLLTEETSVQSLTQQALKEHPELQALKYEEKALKWKSRSALSDIIPSVDLDAYISYRGPYYDSLGLTRSAGISIETQLGDKLGLKIPVNYLGAHRELTAKRLQLQEAKRNLESLIIKAMLDNAQSEQQIHATQREKEASEEAYRLASRRYKVGVGTQVDMLQAARSASTSRAKWVKAVMAFNRAQVELLKTSGQITIPNLLGDLTQQNDPQRQGGRP